MPLIDCELSTPYSLGRKFHSSCCCFWFVRGASRVQSVLRPAPSKSSHLLTPSLLHHCSVHRPISQSKCWHSNKGYRAPKCYTAIL